MADPISLTAATAGFIGLAGQLAQGIIKLKEIYTTLNDAPRDVVNLCSSMDLLRNLLEDIGAQMQQPAYGKIDTRILRDVINQCEASRYRIEAHVRNIGDCIRKNRAAAIKYLFKKSAVQEMASDVEQCKSSLIIARQSIDGAMSTLRHQVSVHKQIGLSSDHRQLLQQTSRIETTVEDVSTQQRLNFDAISHQAASASERSTQGYQSLQDAHRETSSNIARSLLDIRNQLHSQRNNGSSNTILSRIEDIQRDIQTSNRHLENLVSHRSIESRTSSARGTKRLTVGFQSILFSFSVEFSSEQESQQIRDTAVIQSVKKNVCTIRLPNWFVQDQYSLAIARSKSGWLFHPSVYRTVEFDSPLFRACRKGDLETMKMLLTTKQAYLGDRSSPVNEGDTALSYAVWHRQFEACKLLLDAGILSFFQYSDYASVLRKFAYSSTPDLTQERSLLRLIQPKQSPGSDWPDDLELDSWASRVIQDLRSYAQESGASYLVRFEAEVLRMSVNVDYFSTGTNIIMLSEFLRHADHVQDVQATNFCSAWLPHFLAYALCSCRLRDDKSPLQDVLQAASFALGVICDTGLDLHVRLCDLPQAWQSSFPTFNWLGSNSGYSTPFTFVVKNAIRPLRPWLPVRDRGHGLGTVMRLWLETLHSAGVDLVAYAAQEVEMIDVTLPKASSIEQCTYRLSTGPEPDDWRIETGPPGDPYPAYFWRSLEEAPVEEDLAVKVLDLVRRVEHPEESVHFEVPGSWQTHQDEAEQPKWAVKTWLAYMEDGDLTRMEVDLERLDAEEFYKLWDLSSVAEE